MGMTRPYPLIVLLALALAVPAVRAQTNHDTGTINIMQPERPGPARSHKARRSAPKQQAPAEAPAPRQPRAGTTQQKTRHGSSNPVYPTPLPAPQGFTPPPSREVVTRPPAVPPPLYVPETGRTLPNLPAVSGAGPGGAESYQDRAARCAHQAGVYGQAAGNPGAYIGGCINQ